MFRGAVIFIWLRPTVIVRFVSTLKNIKITNLPAASAFIGEALRLILKFHFGPTLNSFPRGLRIGCLLPRSCAADANLLLKTAAEK